MLPLAAGAELAGALVDPEADLSGEAGALVDPDADFSVFGELELAGAPVEPAADLSVLVEAEPEAAPLGAAVEPDGEEDGDVVSRVTFGLLPSPQAAIRLAPNARDTATVRIFKFMGWPPWLGYRTKGCK